MKCYLGGCLVVDRNTSYRHFRGIFFMSVTSHHHRSFFERLNSEGSDKNVNMQILSIAFAAPCNNKYPKPMYWRNDLALLEFWLDKNGSRFFLSLCIVLMVFRRYLSF